MQTSVRRCIQTAAKQASIRDHLLRASQDGSTQKDVVQLNGWIKSIRRQKYVSFLSLGDGSNAEGIQAVIPTDVLATSDVETTSGLQTGASVSLLGTLTEKKGGRRDAATDQAQKAYELQVDTVKLVGVCDGQVYPIQKKDHSALFLRRHAHLRARTSTISSLLRLRDKATQSCYSYFQDQGYINTAMPMITSSDCEGAGEVFSVVHGPDGKQKPFWGDSASYLSVSGQLHLEALAIGGGLGKVWHLGPCFRAERSDTNRHLNEFWMCEAELAWTESLEDVMHLVEGLVRHVANDVLRKNEVDLRLHLQHGEQAVREIVNDTAPWKRMTYRQAIEELELAYSQDQSVFTHEPIYESGLRSEHERYLAAKYGPIFVTDYPVDQKPFYMRANDGVEAGKPTVACFDLLVPRVGELVGGSLREERLDKLTAAMKARGMPLDNYEWYLDLRRYGSVPHGGFGLGWERLVSWLSGIENVRECIPFPRGSEGSRF